MQVEVNKRDAMELMVFLYEWRTIEACSKHFQVSGNTIEQYFKFIKKQALK